jgi:quercetin dioxygenase-like cupin family protein
MTDLETNSNYKQIPLDYVEFSEVDDIWIRSYTLVKAKTVISQHVHEHDHATIVSRGAVEAWQDGEILGQYAAPAVIIIPAGKKHHFMALTDDVVLCCLHNLRGTGLESPKIKE